MIERTSYSFNQSSIIVKNNNFYNDILDECSRQDSSIEVDLYRNREELNKTYILQINLSRKNFFPLAFLNFTIENETKHAKFKHLHLHQLFIAFNR